MAGHPASVLARTAGTEARRTRSRDRRLDPDTPVSSIIGGPLRREFAAVPMSPIIHGDNMSGEEFALTAGSSHFGTGNAATPGQGRIVE